MQLEIEEFTSNVEDPAYLSEQLITYLGNKRSLIGSIEKVVQKVSKNLGNERLSTCDVFSGSGVVSRMLKKYSYEIHANDFESYAALVSRAYLTNKNEIDFASLSKSIEKINKIVLDGKGPKGFIRKLYSPVDDTNIKSGERVFYTNENARRIDAYAQLIREEPEELQDLLLGPLLSAASMHANTGGVFKGFYKNSDTGIGQFGGSGVDALSRIMSPIELKLPVLSKFDSKVNVTQADAAVLFNQMKPIDLAYLDPPYNQHPYGSNYFMLNLIVNYKEPLSISEVSGIPDDWQRSTYNKRNEAFDSLETLVTNLPSRFILLSFSDDGFLNPKDLQSLFKKLGKTEVFDIEYNTYRAARNLAGRAKKITEHLFLVEKN
jgi:adenine-specific DNA-methyltransferase